MVMPMGWKERDAPPDHSQSSMAICTKCNEKTRASSRFCNYCGIKFDDQPFITYDILYKSSSDGIRFTIPEDWTQVSPRELANTPTAKNVRWAFRPPVYEGEEPVLFVLSSNSPDIEAASQKNSVLSMLETMVNNTLDTEDSSSHLIESSIDSVNGIDIARFVRQNNSDQAIELEVATIRNAVLHQIVFKAIKSYQFYFPALEKIISSLDYTE
jgi:hypothetical protein